MKTGYIFILALLLASHEGVMAFTTKKLDPTARSATRPAFAPSSSMTGKDKEESSSAAPVSTPAFAFGTNAAGAAPVGTSNSPSVYQSQQTVEEYEDDDELFGYGTALFSCVLSLALGFTLGYGT